MKICKQCLAVNCGIDQVFVNGAKTEIDKCEGGCGRVVLCYELTLHDLNQMKADGDLLREIEED